MPLAVVVAVPICTQVPDEFTRSSVMVLPGTAVPLEVRVPERVKDWLTAGVVLLEVMVMVEGVRLPTERVTEARGEYA